MSRLCRFEGSKPRKFFSGDFCFFLQIFDELFAKNMYVWVRMEGAEVKLWRELARSLGKERGEAGRQCREPSWGKNSLLCR